MRLLHITDLHLCADPAARLHGWNVEQAFTRVLDDALARYPDYDGLVLGGDLVDDESAAGYARLNKRLSALDRPVLAMAGNHDDPDLMSRLLTSAQVHRSITIAGYRLYALDSHQQNSEAGRVSGEALGWLDHDLRADTTSALIFIHHPPVVVKSAWLDAIGLENADELIACLSAHPHVHAVVCGHVHQAVETGLGQIQCWSTPSTMRQFLPAAATFAEDSRRFPGYRLIETGSDGTLSTTVVRVPTASVCG